MKARARIHLLAEENGGLVDAMTSQCQSLLVHVEASTEDGGGVDLGVRIATSTSEPLRPGVDLDVELMFWSDDAGLHIIPGKRFELRYPIRVVGHGEVLEVLPF